MSARDAFEAMVKEKVFKIVPKRTNWRGDHLVNEWRITSVNADSSVTITAHPIPHMQVGGVNLDELELKD